MKRKRSRRKNKFEENKNCFHLVDAIIDELQKMSDYCPFTYYKPTCAYLNITSELQIARSKISERNGLNSVS